MYFAPHCHKSARLLPVSAHEGSRADFLARHAAEAAAAAREGGAKADALRVALFDRLIDTRTLLAAALHVQSAGGPARGPDGVGPRDLTAPDLPVLARLLGGVIRDGTYRPGAVRTVEIPKPTGGTRTISVQLFADRVVERAVVTIAQPFLDPGFAPTTLGGRPGRSTGEAVARANQLAAADRRVVVTADVRKAFDAVPHGPLLAAVRARLGDTPFVDLIERIVRGRGTVGVAQGGALSMLLLNVLLDAALDLPWAARHPGLPLLRWVDDVLILTPNEEVATTALTDLTGLLAAVGLGLKQTPPPEITDLRTGNYAHWLGYDLSVGPTDLEARIGKIAWTHLDVNLQDAHTANHPAVQAEKTILAWIDAFGPCYRPEDEDDTYDCIVRTASRHGFDDLVTVEEFVAKWKRAAGRYAETKERIEQETDVRLELKTSSESKNITAPPVITTASIVPSAGAFVPSATSTAGCHRPNGREGGQTPLSGNHRFPRRTRHAPTDPARHGMQRAVLRSRGGLSQPPPQPTKRGPGHPVYSPVHDAARLPHRSRSPPSSTESRVTLGVSTPGEDADQLSYHRADRREGVTEAMRTCAALRRAVLESPNSPSDRITYAQALERAGDTDGATAILDNLHQRREGEARCGSSAGLPVATTVALKWGMIAAIEIDRQSVDRLGDVLRKHPVERIRVAGPEVTIEIKTDDGQTVIPPFRDSSVRKWVAIMTRSAARSIAKGVWPTRAALVADLPAWVCENLPADITARDDEVGVDAVIDGWPPQSWYDSPPST